MFAAAANAWTCLLVLCCSLVAATATWEQVNGELCSVWNGRVALVGNQIFFLGGDFLFSGNASGKDQQYLYTLPLNESFTVSEILENGKLYRSSIASDIPYDQTGGALLYDNTTFYVFGGQDSYEPASDVMWAFDVPTTSWSAVTISGGNYQYQNRNQGQYASIPGLGLSFFAGGADSDISGILRLDSSNQTSPTWTNETSFSYDDIESPGPHRYGAQFAFVPAGDEGVLISMGGENTSAIANDSNSYDMCPLYTVDVYDIATKTWYNVPATGDVPDELEEFCHWVTAAPDRSSYSITIYGGLTPGSGSHEDVYVLSVPAFEWIKISSSDNTEGETGYSDLGRTDHHCVKWGAEGGFVVGGNIRNGSSTYINRHACSDTYPPVRLLNLTTYEWETEYTPNSNGSYELSEQIYGVIGGDASGSATMTSPSAGWATSALATIFSKQADIPAAPTDLFTAAEEADASSNGTSSSGSSADATATPDAASESVSGGAIAGAVVGGIAGIGLVTVLGWFLLRRRRNQRLQQQNHLLREPKIEDYYPAPVMLGNEEARYEMSDQRKEVELAHEREIAEAEGREKRAELPG